MPEPALGQVLRPPLGNEHVAVVVDPEGRRTGQHVGAVDRLDDGPFVDEEHPAVQRRRGCRTPGRTTADHERVDVDEFPVEAAAILAFQAAAPGERPGLHPVGDLDDGRPQRRLARAARPANLDDRVRLLGARGEHAARPAGVDAAPHDHDVAGQQSRSDRVAREALVLDVVEPEADGARAVDPGSADR